MKIGFIGAGQMAKALASGLVNSGICQAQDIQISDPNQSACQAFQEAVGPVHIAESNAECASNQDYLFLAVKPQLFKSATDNLSLTGLATTVVSVMGGVPISRIQNALGTDQVVRVMPNTPCLIGAGACGMSPAENVDADRVSTVRQMLTSLGLCVEVPESLLDAVTGLSGSGPAYVFSFIQALADGGVKMGLARETALQLAMHTVYGSAKLVMETGDHPSVLRDRVASPGGTTIHGLHALELEGFHAAVMNAVEEATHRGHELG